jgi:beta-glucosidase
MTPSAQPIRERLIFGTGLALLAAVAAPLAASPAVPLYRQVGAPVEERVRDLITRMTLDEKIAQITSNVTLPQSLRPHCVSERTAIGIIKDGKIDEAVARRAFGKGIGAFYDTSTEMLPPATIVQQQNLMQKWVLDNTRLGIPIIFQGSELHGIQAVGATAFPQKIGLGSTFDRDLMTQMYAIIGREARASGMAMVWGPVLDLARDTRYGRIEEMFSEDPYLTSELGVASVRAMQGGGPKFDENHTAGTAFFHGSPENGTNWGPNDVSERTMRAVELLPLEKAIKQANLNGYMASYMDNAGGVPQVANPWLLKKVIRDEWGFKGIVASDWCALSHLYSQHHIAPSLTDAGAVALKAGLDLELPSDDTFYGLPDALKAGKVKMEDIDTALSHVLTFKFNAGLFERPYSDPKRAAALVGAKTSIAVARQAADESIVLLKNEGAMLPLDPARYRNVAVIGPNAHRIRLGGYSGRPGYFVTPLDGIRKRLGDQVTVRYAEGARISEPDEDPWKNKRVDNQPPSVTRNAQLTAEAVETARKSDLVVLVLGGNEATTREALGENKLGDTDDLDLPPGQVELVREIAKLGKPIVAVLIGGRPFSSETLEASAPAIVEGWYLGQETGNALAGVLFGDVNPSGKLPLTVARNVGQLPVYYYKTPQARMGYVYKDNSPLYPFGFGLSYTTYTYGKPVLATPEIGRSGTTTLSVPVTNTGRRAGTEIVQLYVHPKSSSTVQPVKRLVGFTRILLKPGETRTATFPIGAEQLNVWNLDMKRVVEPGEFDFMVGPSSVDTVTANLRVME